MKITCKQLQKLINETLDEQQGDSGLIQSLLASAERVSRVAAELKQIETRFPGAVENAMENNPPESEGLDDFADWWESMTFYIEGDDLWSEGYMLDPLRWDASTMTWVDDMDPDVMDYDS